VQQQPVLNPDGSLQAPGASKAVPPEVVANLKEAPALIVLPAAGSGNANNTVPQIYQLETGKHIRLGREKANDIVLADVVVSRRHAEILSGPTGFYIRDLGSSNGVLINQTKINGPYRLSHGDRIVMGGTTIFFVDLQFGREPTTRLEQVRPAQPKPAAQAVAAGSGQSRRATASARRTTALQADGRQLQMVICPRCGVANTQVARFCAGCSAQLGNAS
jgi:pSer/pThr/pTyr-binding forkhead associated (FHA) protein